MLSPRCCSPFCLFLSYSVFYLSRSYLACSTDETKLWLSPSAKQRQNPCSGFPPVCQDLSTRHDWLVENAIVDLPIRLRGNSKLTFGNSLSLQGARSKNIGAASQTLITGVKVRLWHRPTATIWHKSETIHLCSERLHVWNLRVWIPMDLPTCLFFHTNFIISSYVTSVKIMQLILWWN